MSFGKPIVFPRYLLTPLGQLDHIVASDHHARAEASLAYITYIFSVIVQTAVIVAYSNNSLANVHCVLGEHTLQCIMHYFEFRVQKYFAFVNKSERNAVVYESKTSKAPRSAELSIDLV